MANWTDSFACGLNIFSAVDFVHLISGSLWQSGRKKKYLFMLFNKMSVLPDAAQAVMGMGYQWRCGRARA
jgi:hypothetical protein